MFGGLFVSVRKQVGQKKKWLPSSDKSNSDLQDLKVEIQSFN